jgi:uncharacterized protein (DUF58 family)
MVPSEILHAIRHIEFGTRQMINTVMAGAYHSSFKGNGMEFADVREYIAGDDVRAIDWNVTARSGKAYIKQFVEERELTLLLVVDQSASGLFGSRNHLKNEVAATLSALLAFAAERNNDKVGLLTFAEEPELYLAPAKGRKHVLRMVREVLVNEPKTKGTSIKAAAEQVQKLLKRKSVVIFLSDFKDKGYEKSLRLLNKRHEVMAVQIKDPLESDLPDVGIVQFDDAETGQKLEVDTSSSRVREAFKESSDQHSVELKTLLKKVGVDHVCIDIQDDYKTTMNPLLKYFSRRGKHR